VVDRELYLPMSAALKSQFHRVLERSASFQGRVATSQQIQVPINFPQHAKWLDLFTGWWTEGFRRWRARNPESEDAIFLCELGPRDYAITDAQGHEMSDRWVEAQQLREIALKCWSDAAPAGLGSGR
jgi:hypothetical protein